MPGAGWSSNRAAMAGIAVLALMTLMAIFAPFLSSWRYDEVNYDLINCAPAWWPADATCTAPGHILGTDAVGRDLFVRTLYGARMRPGGGPGRHPGLAADRGDLRRHGRLSGRAHRFADDARGRHPLFPALHLFVIILMVVFDRNLILLFVAVGAVEWLTMARIVRGQTLSIKQKEFVEAARAAGVSGFGIIRRHIIPNTVGPVVVYVTLTVPAVILTESFLSFLGLGVQEPLTRWGTLISDGAAQMETATWILLFPALFMAVTLFCFNFHRRRPARRLDPRDR